MTDEKTTPEGLASHGDELSGTATGGTPLDAVATEPETAVYEPVAEPSAARPAGDGAVTSEAHVPSTDAAPVTSAGGSTPLTSAAGDGGVPPQYGIGPFSLREVALLGVWALSFLFSFFPLYVSDEFSRFFGGATVWTSGIDWVLTIGAPTVAVFLIVLRRFSPDGIRRVGSLGIDQFASVTFSVSALIWLGWLWSNIARGVQSGYWFSSWVVWVEVILFLAAVVLTVFAPFIPPFHEDFLHRDESRAHRVARGARPVVARPVSDARYTMAAPSVDPEPAPFADSLGGDAPAPVATPVHQAFWALVPVERDVVDENGIPLFRIGPTAWALVIEDRGDSFVVRHEDGRIGYLTDVSGVTRG